MLKPGDRIGILGGGQLGRMLALAAAPLGLKTVIFAPERESPAFEVSSHHICAAYEDQEALSDFASQVDRVTYEFENVPLSTARFIEAKQLLAPNARALEITQDRFLEKTFISNLGIPLAPFLPVSKAEDLKEACEQVGFPCILKTRRFGYDGKGQIMIRSLNEIEDALRLVRQAPCIVEAFVPFTDEVSVIAARSDNGEFSVFDLCLNRHKNHILDETEIPSFLPQATEEQARAIAKKITDNLDYTGVLTIELFVVIKDDIRQLVVNEIAPRVHNSGHWTIEGAVTSQFEQHIRAICGWPLGSTRRLGRIFMKNLIGSDYHQWLSLLEQKGTHLHLYGKTDIREGRKMGHITCILPEEA